MEQNKRKDPNLAILDALGLGDVKGITSVTITLLPNSPPQVTVGRYIYDETEADELDELAVVFSKSELIPKVD